MRWIIGDVHGMLNCLEALLEAVGRADSNPTYLFVGDFVNRGPQARGVIDLLLNLSNARFCRGNHDDIFDLVLHGQCYADNASDGNRLAAFAWFMNYGLDNTFISYGADLAHLQWMEPRAREGKLPIEAMEELVEIVPAEHKRFIRTLPGLVEDDDLFVMHAKWGVADESELPGPAVRLAAKATLRHRVLWGRYTTDEVHAQKPWLRTGYFGHTPVTHYINATHEDDIVPIVGPHIVLLDTAAALSTSGRLTAYCADTGDYRQVDHFGKPVSKDAAARK